MTKDAFWLLVGIVVGAAGAIIGGVIEHRRRFVRETRVRIHEELLPRVTKWTPNDEWHSDSATRVIGWKPVYIETRGVDRAVKSLGRRDRMQFQSVIRRLEAMRDIDTASPVTLDASPVDPQTGQRVRFGGDAEIEAKYVDACDQLWDALRSYEKWLARRIL